MSIAAVLVRKPASAPTVLNPSISIAFTEGYTLIHSHRAVGCASRVEGADVGCFSVATQPVEPARRLNVLRRRRWRVED